MLAALPLLAFGVRAQGRIDAPTDISLASDTWHDLTRKDGSGLYFDLIRAVYARAGIQQVRIQIQPYARTVTMVRDKRADAWVASFLGEKDFPLYPKWHFDRNAQMAVYRADAAVPYEGQASLSQRRVAWLRDFGLDRYIQVPMQVTEVDTMASAFGMLDKKRIDFFVGAKSDLADHIRDAKVDMSLYRMAFVVHLGLYLAFANTAKGAALRSIWDEQMEVLHKSRDFLAIYGRYGYETPFS
ncbi:substrate-binding periplasmic protein [Pseudorhodoferax sp.]|uniref:substrate-binding periplasmic protein n=1 Tax=Pseudorhodoferax sp. TaxID=1993553 RepID=UPI002DD69C56|nr:transporter substrate-binding domain-containing protein [Pseudorhodoferax sp.]